MIMQIFMLWKQQSLEEFDFESSQIDYWPFTTTLQVDLNLLTCKSHLHLKLLRHKQLWWSSRMMSWCFRYLKMKF